MDHAKHGADALEGGRYDDAIKAYTAAIKSSPTSPDYHIKRSTAYQRTAPPEYKLALRDAETAVVLAQKRAKRELILQAQLRRAIALFFLERYADSKFLLDIVQGMDPQEKTLAIWQAKVDTKLKALGEDHSGRNITVTETPVISENKTNVQVEDAATKLGNASIDAPKPAAPVQTPKEKIKHDWYQQDDKVVVTLMVKGAPQETTTVEIEEQSLAINFPLVTGATYDLDLDLWAAIDPALSSFKVMSTKIEVTLRKKQPGQKWKKLESDGPVPATTASTSVSAKPVAPVSTGPLYPSSSRTGPKNWDKLADELTAKKQKDSKADGSKADSKDDDDYDYDAEGGDPANAFFKKLYKGASDDVRRAMMKSYQESNGTALSTNWNEVKKAKVATRPPDGVEAKPWNA